jgi:hypothetical protein
LFEDLKLNQRALMVLKILGCIGKKGITVFASILFNSRHPFSGQTFPVKAAYDIPV